jgi:hypothetical protein
MRWCEWRRHHKDAMIDVCNNITPSINLQTLMCKWDTGRDVWCTGMTASHAMHMQVIHYRILCLNLLWRAQKGCFEILLKMYLVSVISKLIPKLHWCDNIHSHVDTYLKTCDYTRSHGDTYLNRKHHLLPGCLVRSTRIAHRGERMPDDSEV